MPNLTANQIELVDHLVAHGLKTDGPYVLSSGKMSDWYLDGRQTTFDGSGGRVVGRCILEVLDETATVVGGMTMGADPIAVAAAVMSHRPLRAFSVRKQEKGHGMKGRLVGPIGPGDRAVVVEDTVTTGAAMAEAVEILQSEGVDVVQAIVLVDRSNGAAGSRLSALDIPLVSLLVPADLGVGR